RDRLDLAPQLVEEGNTHQFAGVSLALQHIAPPEFALEEYALDKAIAEANEALAKAEKAEAQQAEAAREAEQRVAALTTALHAAERATQQAEQEVEYAKSARDNLRQEHHAKERQRRNDWLAEQTQLEERKHKAAADKEGRLQEIEQDYQHKRIELNADHDEAIERQRESMRDIEQQRARRKADDDERLAELEQHFYAQLESKGLDHQKVKQAEAKLKELEQRIHNTEKRRDELTEYSSFMRTEWEQTKPILVAREAELEEHIRVDSDALSACQQQYNSQRKALVATQQEWKAVQQQSAQWLEALAPILEQFNELTPPEAPVEPAEAATMGNQDERIERGRY